MNQNVAYNAFLFARVAHKEQKRKYTGDPYINHLAEVAGYVASVDGDPRSIAVAYLHDTIEDTDVTYDQLVDEFGTEIADGVLMLTDVEEGNRKERKAAAVIRLSQAPRWIQTIKYADFISNSSSIMLHDPDFAKVYVKEIYDALLEMKAGDTRLWTVALAQVTS